MNKIKSKESDTGRDTGCSADSIKYQNKSGFRHFCCRNSDEIRTVLKLPFPFICQLGMVQVKIYKAVICFSPDVISKISDVPCLCLKQHGLAIKQTAHLWKISSFESDLMTAYPIWWTLSSETPHNANSECILGVVGLSQKQPTIATKSRWTTIRGTKACLNQTAL